MLAVARRLAAVAIAAQVRRHDREVRRQQRRNAVPAAHAICGKPCRSSSGGPLPPIARLISHPAVATRRRSNPSNISGILQEVAGGEYNKTASVDCGVGRGRWRCPELLTGRRERTRLDPVHAPDHIAAAGFARYCRSPRRVSQSDIVGMTAQAFDRENSEIERMIPVFGNAGIDTRHFCMPGEWYLEPHGWAERSRLYVEHSVNLLAEVALKCLDDAGCKVEDVDAIVTVSTTGICTPSLDALVMERLGMRRDIRRLPLFGLGCAGGVIGLSRAAEMAAVRPGGACCCWWSSSAA